MSRQCQTVILPAKLLLRGSTIFHTVRFIVLLNIGVWVIREDNCSKFAIENTFCLAGLNLFAILFLSIACGVAEESYAEFRVLNEVLYGSFCP